MTNIDIGLLKTIQAELKVLKMLVTTPKVVRSIERLERLVNTTLDRDSVEKFERNACMSDYVEKIIQEKGHLNDITKKDGEKFFVERVSSDIVRENKNLENLVHLKDQIIKDLYREVESYRDTILDTDDKLSNLRKLLTTKDEQIGDLTIKIKTLQDYTSQRVSTPMPPSRIEQLSREIDDLKIRFDEIQDIVLVVNTILSGGSISIPQGKSVEWTPEYRDIETARSVITRNLRNLKSWDDPSTSLKGFASPLTEQEYLDEDIKEDDDDDTI